MQIFVKVFTANIYRTVVVQVESSDTVDSVKAKLEELVSIPAELQRLYYGGYLADGRKRLSDHNIVNLSTLHLTLRFFCGCGCQRTIDIYVQTRTSKTLALEVEPSSDTIANVRRKISGHQSLFLAGKKLEDDKTFGHYQEIIKNGTTLHLDFGMQVFVKMLSGSGSSKTITVDVEPSETVGDIKAKIQDQQRLVFDGGRLNNKHKLDFYNQVQHHSTLHLDNQLCSPRDDAMQIAVKMTLPDSASSEAIRFKVTLNTKIGNFKAEIQNFQRLLFKGQQLLDNGDDGQTMTLADYGVQRQSTLHLDCPMQVFVRTSSTGQTITLEVEPSNTIGDVKEKVSGGDQSLSLHFDGKKLDDGKTLVECNVHMGSTLHLDPYN